MRSCRSLFMTLALLVVFATSSFALGSSTPLIVYPLNTWGDYHMGEVWTGRFGTGPDTQSAKFDIDINLLGGSWNTSTDKNSFVLLSAALNDQVFFIDLPTTNAGTYNISTMLDISSGPSLYTLTIVASDLWGENLAAHWTVNKATVAVTPIPAAFLLLGSGLVGLFGVNKSRKLGKGSIA